MTDLTPRGTAEPEYAPSISPQGDSSAVDSLSPERRALLLHMLREKQAAQAPLAHDQPAPQLRHDEAARFDPFPLTDLQQAYWIGRSDSFALGSIASKAYLEVEVDDFHLEHFRTAWARLVDRHDMLRMVALDDGTQHVLPEPPPFVIPADLITGDTDAVERQLNLTRQRMVAALSPADQWPLFDVYVSMLENGSARVHITLDLLIADAGSIAILFRDLARLYSDNRAQLEPIRVTFRDYVLAQTNAPESDAEFRAAETYWLNRIADFPAAPDLALVKDPSTARAVFTRRTAALTVEQSAALKRQMRDHGLTASSVMLAAYGEILGVWSRNRRFAINIPLFNRPPLHPDLPGVVGAFTSVNLLEIDRTAGESFLARAQRVQSQLADDLDHRAYDGVRVMREIARNSGRAAMPVVFTSLVDVGFGDSVTALGRITHGLNQTAQVWLDLHIDEHDGAYTAKLDAVDELFPSGMVADMLDAYVTLLGALSEGPEAWTSTHRMLLPPEQQTLRTEMNQTSAPVPGGLIHTRVAEVVAAHPNRTAVIADGRELSYGELWDRARRVGERLRDQGARPDTLVAVAMEKGWEQIVAVYGVLWSGAAYIPVDPDLPAERFQHLLAHGEVSLVLTQERLETRLPWPPQVKRLRVDVDTDWEGTSGEIEPVQDPSDLAYVLYTSGSTGLPKGVMIEHQSVVNRMVDVIERFRITPDDRAIALTALHHDLSIFDQFAMLMAGGSIVIPSAADRRDPAHWDRLIRDSHVTTWNSVPAFMAMFMEYIESRGTSDDLPLERVMLSGDWVPVDLPDRVRARASRAYVISLGGPTETTVWDICYPVATVEPHWTSIPYGRPMTNAGYHILNEAMDDCPDGVSGELYISGTGLARGYWRDEQRTAAAFATHPRTGARLYRSGDTGRLLPNGLIEFTGRQDFQVKIQGQRIELGEIEAALLRNDAIQAAIVAAPGERDRKQLVAYIVFTEGCHATSDELREALEQTLPQHMIPRTFVTLDSLPLTPNGKVNRNALPARQTVEAPADTADGGRDTELTGRIARVVGDVLKIEQPDLSSNLLNLGANSLDMVRIGNALEKEFGARPSMDELFRLQSIAALAGFYEKRDGGAGDNASSGPNAPLSGVDARLANYRVMLDPDEVARFKATLPSIRTDIACIAPLRLPAAAPEHSRYTARHSQRTFALKPVALESLAALLSHLDPIDKDGKKKYLYASPGGIYPIQVYLHIKPGRVEGLGGGTYYYHPLQHALLPLYPGAEIDRSIHIPFINTPTFDEAAFSLFLITDLDAIGPVYGPHSLRFSTIEAGIIAHMLEDAADPAGLGLCQVGSIEFERIRDLFALNESHVLVHSLLGGIPENRSDANDTTRVESLAGRIQDLSPDEVRALLAANTGAAPR